MHRRPSVIAFDVNETLFSLAPVGARMQQLGLPAEAIRLLFAQLLRDAFALEASGRFVPFKVLAAESIEVMLACYGLPVDPFLVGHVFQGFSEMPAHPDVRPAFELARAGGARILAITNGSAENTIRLLEQAGLRDFVERVVSIDQVQRWKPNREVYLYAARVSGVDPSAVAMVAVHAWDTHGAKQAGLTTAWVERLDKVYLPSFAPPDVRAQNLEAAVEKLLASAPN
jgi:2-haloacid dehalogenase